MINSECEMSEEPLDITQVFLKINLPQDRRLSKLSLEFPNLKLYILSLTPFSSPQGLALLQVVGTQIEQFINLVATLFSNLEYSIMGQLENQLLISLQLADPWFLNQMMEIGLNARYPILIEAGMMHLEIIAPRNKIDNLLTHFESASITTHMEQIGSFHMKAILSPNQEKILEHAIQWNYFDIPRKISLHEFATRENISASALSESLRRILLKLANEYLKTRFVSIG